MAMPSPAETSPIPALAPPEGLKSDFSTLYTGLQPISIAIPSLCILLSTSILAARLAAKVWATKRLNVEDWVTFLAWAGFVGWAGLGTFAVCHGLGRHQWDITVSQMIHISRLLNAAEVLFCVVIYAAKLGLLLQYMRIFVVAKRGLIYRAIQFLIWSNLVVYTAIFFWLIFACNPREKIWNPAVPGHCSDPEVNSLFSSSWNLFSDLSCLTLPLYSIWKLQLPIKRKAGVSAVFAIGAIGCAASVGRMIFGVRLLHTKDQNFVSQQNGLLSIIEITMIIICSNLPLLPKFFQLIRHGRKGHPSDIEHQQQRLSRRSSGPSSSSSKLVRNRDLPWDNSATSLSRLANSYVPLHGIDGNHHHGTSSKAYFLRGGPDAAGGEGSNLEKRLGGNEILKTVRLESTTSTL